MGFASIASLAAVGTGLTAFNLKGFPLTGIYAAHMSLGSLAAICMAVCGLMKKKDPQVSGPAYWVVLAIGAAATAGAGHLGATIVFG